MEHREWGHRPIFGARSPGATPPRGPRWTATLALLGAVAAAALSSAFACSSNGGPNQFASSSSSGTPGAGGSGAGGAGGSGDGGNIFAGSGGAAAALKVTPGSPIIKVEVPIASAQPVQFSCIDTITNLPAPNATWSLDTIALGTIDMKGLYTPNGSSSGSVQVTCASGSSTASTKLKVLIHASDNMGVSPGDQTTLKGPPGQSDAQWQMLYPYDQTVFPKGILAPEVHLTSGSAPGTAYYMHILVGDYEYEGFFNVSAQSTQLQMSQAAWDALTNSANGKKVDVQISKVANGQKYGPIFRQWVLAAGKLHGTIYYNTYNSPLAQQNGAMLRIKGTSSTPEVLLGNCTVCHSISSDGSTAAAANHGGIGGVFDLSGGNVNPPNVWNEQERAAFAALYPKQGSVLVVNGAPSSNWPPNTPGTSEAWYSELRTKNGTLIPSSGIEGYYAMSPVFSHDGTMLAFNDRSGVPVQGGPQGQYWPGALALMDYDSAAQKFSNYRVLTTPPPGRQYSWPAFTPDNRFVVYQDGQGEDLATWSGNTAKIFAVDVQTKQVVFLANLNGDGYVPQGARDQNKNYEPTIAPIASGGYFWVMFTSRRTYGNKLTQDESQTKRLWVSAFDVNAKPGADASHPPFYISGQELTSGNSRGFWALDPCKGDGQSCETGDECCNGFCNPTNTPNTFVCGPPMGGCSQEFEDCKTAADCCDQNFECIGSKCTKLPPN